MLVRLRKTSYQKLEAYKFDLSKAYIVTAVYYSANGEKDLHYMTNANFTKQGGVPASFDNDDIIIEDGFIPHDWIIAQQTDKYGQYRTIMTFPEWAADPDYYDKLDDNEDDNKASKAYMRELKSLVEHYKKSSISGVSLEPFDRS